MKDRLEDMLKRIDVEYLKRMNAFRKQMGLSLDFDQLKKHSFLSTIAELRKPYRK